MPCCRGCYEPAPCPVPLCPSPAHTLAPPSPADYLKVPREQVAMTLYPWMEAHERSERMRRWLQSEVGGSLAGPPARKERAVLCTGMS